MTDSRQENQRSATLPPSAEAYALARIRLLEVVASGVAHDVNNPLQAVLNYAQLLDSVRDAASVGEFAEEITSAATEAAQKLNSFFDLARREAPSLRAQEMRLLLESAVRLVAYRFQRQQRSIELEVGPVLPQVEGDTSLLLGCLVELLLHSLEVPTAAVLVPAKVHVELRAVESSAGAYVELSVPSPLRAANELQPESPALPLTSYVVTRLGGTLQLDATRIHRLQLRLPALGQGVTLSR